MRQERRDFTRKREKSNEKETCVVLPHPVSPLTTTTWLSRIAFKTFSLSFKAGNLGMADSGLPRGPPPGFANKGGMYRGTVFRDSKALRGGAFPIS